jgi:hypothetical protein
MLLPSCVIGLNGGESMIDCQIQKYELPPRAL